jgi:hypothetical protein
MHRAATSAPAPEGSPAHPSARDCGFGSGEPSFDLRFRNGETYPVATRRVLLRCGGLFQRVGENETHILQNNHLNDSPSSIYDSGIAESLQTFNKKLKRLGNKTVAQ